MQGLRLRRRWDFRGDGKPEVLVFSNFDILVFTGRIYAQMTVALSFILTQSCDCPPAGNCTGLIISTSTLASEFGSAEATATMDGARSPVLTGGFQSHRSLWNNDNQTHPCGHSSIP